MPPRNLLVIGLSAVISLACYAKTMRDRDAAVIYSALQVIDQTYYEPVERERLFDGAIRGMVDQLDEYSEYLTGEALREFEVTIDQEFAGIGIVVEVHPDTKRLTVLSPVVGGPAHRAGLRAGDVILAINGQSTEGMELSDAVPLIRGPEGEEVELVVRHAGEEEPRTYRIRREKIEVDSVLGDTRRPDGSWNFFLEDYPQIGYVRVVSFGQRTRDELHQVLQSHGLRMQALILDLRGNPGGLLSAAIDVCDLFLDGGVVVSIRGRGGKMLKSYRARPGVALPADVPMVVLVNRFSASASEIVAGCLQDHRRAVIVGERTYGKGTVQNVIELYGARHDAALRLTTATYWRPSGKNIHRGRDAKDEDEWGVRPNPGMEVVLSDDQLRRLLEYRHQRDYPEVVHSIVSGPSDGQDADDQEPDGGEGASGSIDPQLDKAVEYLLGVLRQQSRRT